MAGIASAASGGNAFAALRAFDEVGRLFERDRVERLPEVVRRAAATLWLRDATPLRAALRPRRRAGAAPDAGRLRSSRRRPPTPAPHRERGRPVSLREFVELLRREGELAVVAAPVDPYLEMAEIADRASKAGGPALLFERPVAAAARRRAAGQRHRLTGPPLPVLMNQFGSYRRLELALGAPLDELAARIGELVELQIPKGLVGKVKALGQLRELASFTPKVVGKAAFRDVVVEPPDLGRLPVLTTWPGDGGPFVTLPVCVTKDREGRRNAGMYRLQVYDAPHDRHALARAPRRRGQLPAA